MTRVTAIRPEATSRADRANLSFRFLCLVSHCTFLQQFYFYSLKIDSYGRNLQRICPGWYHWPATPEYIIKLPLHPPLNYHYLPFTGIITISQLPTPEALFLNVSPFFPKREENACSETASPSFHFPFSSTSCLIISARRLFLVYFFRSIQWWAVTAVTFFAFS